MSEIIFLLVVRDLVEELRSFYGVTNLSRSLLPVVVLEGFDELLLLFLSTGQEILDQKVRNFGPIVTSLLLVT